MTVWDSLRHFSKKENWGDPNKVSPLLLEILDAYRHELGIRLYVSRSVAYPESLSARPSAHYPDETGYSKAVDLIPQFDAQGQNLFDCYALATKYPFCGIGLYPYWRLSAFRNNRKIVYTGGIHLDVADTLRTLPKMRTGAQWIGIRNQKNEPRYFELSKWQLKRFALI